MIRIDNEFKTLIPALTADERKGLEESILKEGCRDALVLWGDILIDGHNRYEICTKHNIPFKTVQRDFASRDDVILWMIGNQLARRNINTYARTTLESLSDDILSKRAKAKEKQANAGGDKKSDEYKKIAFCEITKSDKPADRTDLTKELAKKANTGEQTASRVMTINKKIDTAIKESKPIAGQKPEELKKQLMDGNISINKAYNAIKLEEKKETIRQAEKKIAEQASDEYKPVIFIADSLKTAPKAKFDLLLTDPPYSTDIDDIKSFVDKWLYRTLDKVKDTGFAYIFIGAYPEEIAAYLNAETPEHIKLIQPLIWTYKNTLGNNPRDRYKLNYQMCLFYRGVNAPALDCPLTSEQWAVQEINAPDGRQGDRYHTWQKPIELAERFIRHSTKPGMMIYDPFACTGTFLLAAAKLGRKAIGIEIDADNANIAVQRGCVLNELG